MKDANGDDSEMLLHSKLCASTPLSALGLLAGFGFCLLTPFVATSRCVCVRVRVRVRARARVCVCVCVCLSPGL
jgi:hypothetical protein